MNSSSETTVDPINLNISYEVVEPIVSYIALALVLIFILVLIVSRLVITTEKSKSDLILFNQSPHKHLELLVSNKSANSGAMNNMHAAIAVGLMIPPPGYEPPPKDPTKSNGIGPKKMRNAGDGPVARSKKPKF
ncbi:hypothetical protein BpHYR1_052255 [Brachionus plicatilis]|uniref:Uncharacterized protein n=1 Tax=Brachionus plicatilis TaxID=10195 RepID=A0A3M7TA51_BRAPC|nr:hypothetical protein BpHYR1_052255 [Brachionus plicatilis]